MKLLIGLSYAPEDQPKYHFYFDAVKRAAEKLEEEVEVIDLSKEPGRIAEVDGVLFTGGADIEPSRYGKPDEAPLCQLIDQKCDELEYAIAKDAERLALPQLGICRGAQLLNVIHGGTLVTDIEHFGGEAHTKIGTEDRKHNVKVVRDSLLKKLLRESEGEINSAHHQAIGEIGEGLMVSARADDGTAEAIEWADPKGKPFLLAVQWHPERLDYASKFSHPIFESFVWEVAANKVLKHRIAKNAEA